MGNILTSQHCPQFSRGCHDELSDRFQRRLVEALFVRLERDLYRQRLFPGALMMNGTRWSIRPS